MIIYVVLLWKYRGRRDLLGAFFRYLFFANHIVSLGPFIADPVVLPYRGMSNKREHLASHVPQLNKLSIKYFDRFSAGILGCQAGCLRLFDTPRYICGNSSKLMVDKANK